MSYEKPGWYVNNFDDKWWKKVPENRLPSTWPVWQTVAQVEEALRRKHDEKSKYRNYPNWK